MNWFSDNRPSQPAPVIVEIQVSGTDYRFTDFDEEELYGQPGDYEMESVTVTVMADLGEDDYTRPVLSRLHLSTPEEMEWAPKMGRSNFSGLRITTSHSCGTTQKLMLGCDELPIIAVGPEGVSIGQYLIGWQEGKWNDNWDSDDCVEALYEGQPLDGLNFQEWEEELGSLVHCIPPQVSYSLFIAMRDLPCDRLELIISLLHELDYLVHYGNTSPIARSPEQFILAMTREPERILDLAFTLPWERANHLTGPASLMLWLEENHPQSPRCRSLLPSSRLPEQPTPATMNTYSSPSPTSPLSSEGELALNAMLGTMKVKGVLTDEMISQEEGEIILGKPFKEWPKELQEKLIPFGASPAIR